METTTNLKRGGTVVTLIRKGIKNNAKKINPSLNHISSLKSNHIPSVT